MRPSLRLIPRRSRPRLPQATLLAAEPDLSHEILRLKGLDAIVTYSLRGHRSNPSVLQAACAALSRLLRASGGAAAQAAATLELPHLLCDAALPLAADHALVAAAAADLLEALLVSADGHPGFRPAANPDGPGGPPHTHAHTHALHPHPPAAASSSRQPRPSRVSTAASATVAASPPEQQHHHQQQADSDDSFFNLPRQIDAALFHGSPNGGPPFLLQRLLSSGLAHPENLELGRALASLVASLFADHPCRPGPALAAAATQAGCVQFTSRLLFLHSKPAAPPPPHTPASALGRRRTTEPSPRAASSTTGAPPSAAAAPPDGDTPLPDLGPGGALHRIGELALAQILSGEGCEREARAPPSSTHAH